jgi:hypothetical protein
VWRHVKSYLRCAVLISPHCTFAETEAAPFSVTIHVLVLLPPLEQVPDQTASRPLLTESVTLVPVAKEACPELPTATFIPVGLEVTRSPLRPLTVTDKVAFEGGGGAAGFTVRGASCVMPPAVAKIVRPVDCVTAAVGTENDTLVWPTGTVTLAGTVAIGLLLDRVAVNPPAGAGLVTARIASVAVPPVTTLGNSPMLCNCAGGGTGNTVTVAALDELL